HARFLELAQDRRQALREHVALADDAYDHEVADAPVALHNFVRDPVKRAADLIPVHHRRLEATFGDAHVSMRSRSAMRTWRPLRAWRKYADLGSSSTSGEISSTRGSGCMRIAYLRIRSIAVLSMR